MGFFNSNAIHNILNAVGWTIGGLQTAAIVTGCTDTDPSSAVVLECAKSFLPITVTVPVLTGILLIKQVMNLTRDGFKGLFKQQPPVADAITTVVTPVQKVEAGQAVEVVATVTAAPAPAAKQKTNFNRGGR